MINETAGETLDQSLYVKSGGVYTVILQMDSSAQKVSCP